MRNRGYITATSTTSKFNHTWTRTHGVDVSASWSSICCPGMRITIDVHAGLTAECAAVDLLRAGESPARLGDDELTADWLAVTQSTASDITCMLLCSTPAWTFCCIAAFNLCQWHSLKIIHKMLISKLNKFMHTRPIQQSETTSVLTAIFQVNLS